MPAAGDRVTTLALPAEVATFGNGTNSIVSNGTWAVLPTTTADATITNPSIVYSLFVQVSYGCWMVSNGSDVRACISASGGLTITPGIGAGGALGWGEILYLGNLASTISLQHHSSFTCTIPAGAAAVTFAWQAYRTSASTSNQVNYPVTRVTPLYYI